MAHASPRSSCPRQGGEIMLGLPLERSLGDREGVVCYPPDIGETLPFVREKSMLPCPRCSGAEVKKDGRAGEAQRYRCRSCRRTFIDRTGTPFAGHRWPREVIVTAVRWYVRYLLWLELHPPTSRGALVGMVESTEDRDRADRPRRARQLPS